MPKIMYFIYQALILYCNGVSDDAFVDKELFELLIILSGAFNVNFVSEETQPSIIF